MAVCALEIHCVGWLIMYLTLLYLMNVGRSDGNTVWGWWIMYFKCYYQELYVRIGSKVHGQLSISCMHLWIYDDFNKCMHVWYFYECLHALIHQTYACIDVSLHVWMGMGYDEVNWRKLSQSLTKCRIVSKLYEFWVDIKSLIYLK
mgnify:CR=1 FL=1